MKTILLAVVALVIYAGVTATAADGLRQGATVAIQKHMEVIK